MKTTTAFTPALRWSSAHVSRRLARSLPWIGAVVAVLTVGAAMRRKGFYGGLADTGLNAIPFVGAAKNVAELMRGRDFVPDRPRAPRSAHARMPRPRSRSIRSR